MDGEEATTENASPLGDHPEDRSTGTATGAGDDEEISHAEASNTVATEEDSHVDDERSMDTAPDHVDDEVEEKTKDVDGGEDSAEKKVSGTSNDQAADTKKKRRVVPPSSRRGRAPAVKGLTIPFRTVKKAMKLDPDIPIVQNEAAICVTMAAELFLRSLARESQQIAKNRGRNTIRYEDVAEARCNDASLAFLESLMP